MIGIDDAEQYQLLNQANQVFAELKVHPSIQRTLRENGKSAEGGYLCVTNREGIPLLIAHIGVSEDSKAADRLRFSQEKAARLAIHPAHYLSRESENKEMYQYPGAVRAHELIFSFSGLPGHLDELCMLILAVRVERLSKRTARALLATYVNDYVDNQIISDFLSVRS